MDLLGTMGGWYMSAYQTMGGWLGLLPLIITGVSMAWAGVRRLPLRVGLVALVALVVFGYVLPFSDKYMRLDHEIAQYTRDYRERRCEDTIYTDGFDTQCDNARHRMTTPRFWQAHSHAIDTTCARVVSLVTSSAFYVVGGAVLLGLGARFGGQAMATRQHALDFAKLHPQ